LLKLYILPFFTGCSIAPLLAWTGRGYFGLLGRLLKGWSRPHLARNRRGRRLAARITWVHGGRGRSRRLRRTYAKIGSSHSIAVTLVLVGQIIAVTLVLPS
jgi:hypothetical protein